MYTLPSFILSPFYSSYTLQRMVCTSNSSPSSSAPRKLSCVRCGKTFLSSTNHSRACLYHGDILGNTMPLSLYEDHHFDDPMLDGKKGPRYGVRWACCQDTDANAPPCKHGFHVTWDCSKKRWAQGVGFQVR